MKAKTMKILGIVFLAMGIVGIAGGIFFWFFHYSAMENGFYHYGDSLMIACTISLFIGLLIYPAIPLLIVSKVRKNRESANPVIQNNIVKCCSNCGAKHNFNANFCSNCGKKFN